MSSIQNAVPGAAVRGTALGVLFMAFFGTMWAYTGSIGLQGWGGPWPLLVSIVLGLTLIFSAVLLIHSSHRLPNQVPEEGGSFGKRIRLWFNIIFAAEGLAIAITIAVCNATGHTEWIPLIVAIIVGVHFFPLAALFKVRLYHVTGALLCLLAIVTGWVAPFEGEWRGYEIYPSMSVVGFGSAFILWGTAFMIWRMGRSLLLQKRY